MKLSRPRQTCVIARCASLTRGVILRPCQALPARASTFIMRRLRTLSVALVAFALALGVAAQSPASASLWRVYLAAGAHASEVQNWPEAEVLYISAMQNAEHLKTSEPYYSIARYCLASTYWKQGRKDDVIQTLKTVKLTLDSSQVHSDLYQSAAVLSSLGNLFYNIAESEIKDAKDKKLEGEPLQKANSDAIQDYHFSRRFYQWTFIIDKQFMPPLGPELEDIAAGLALSTYDAEEYADALPIFQELFQIIQAGSQRDTALAKGSMAYSLASKGPTGAAPQILSPAAVALFIGLSGESVGNGLSQEKPEDAVRQYAEVEPYLARYLNDPTYGHNLRIILKRLYGEHANVLRRLHQQAQADKLESLQKSIPAPTE
jgi:hypothetical protein